MQTMHRQEMEFREVVMHLTDRVQMKILHHHLKHQPKLQMMKRNLKMFLKMNMKRMICRK